MKKIYFVNRVIALVFFLTSSFGVSAVTSSYYSSLDGKSGTTLFSALTTVSATGYTSHGYDDLWTYFGTTDLNSSGKIWDMYSDCTFTLSTNQCGSYSNECDCYNREHSLPKSWFGGSTSNAPGNDLFHLVPTDGKVNGYRSNYPFGEVSAPTYTSGNGSKLGPNTLGSYSGTAFEPVDEYKGDFARGYLGMVVRYANSFAFTTGEGASIFNTTFTSVGNYGLTEYGVALLMKWHRQDPVSQKEIDRNNGIQTTQGNRNPFIDYPCLAEYLWGTHKDETVTLSNLVGSFESSFTVGSCDGCTVSTAPTITSPTSSSLAFSVAPNVTDDQIITVSGVNLTAAISLTVSGTNSDLFSLSASSVAQSSGSAGGNITITYSPTAVGTHSATLTLSSTGCSDVTVTLNGTCSAPAQAEGADPTIILGVPITDALVFPSGVNSKTLYIQIDNLLGAVTVTLSNVSGGFAANKATISKSDAATGTSLVITRTGTGGATLTFGGAISKAITLTGE
jgi:endonuclease I